jgi:hypothetical protein
MGKIKLEMRAIGRWASGHGELHRRRKLGRRRREKEKREHQRLGPYNIEDEASRHCEHLLGLDKEAVACPRARRQQK